MIIPLLLGLGLARAGDLPVHAAVVVDPTLEDSASGPVEQALTAAGTTLTSPDWIRRRLGETPAELYARCFTDASCWATAGELVALDQWWIVESVDEGRTGVRVVDVGRRAARQVSGPAASPLVTELLEGEGVVRVEGGPETLVVSIGGEVTDGRLVEVEAGKHTIELQAEGHVPRFEVVMVAPGEEVVVDAQLLPAVKPRRRWAPPFVLLGVLSAGVAGVVVSRSGGAAETTP